MTQMSTSVQLTLEDVVLKPAAVTRRVVSHVPVTTVSREMDSLVLVSQLRHVFLMSDYFSISNRSSFLIYVV